MKTILISVLFLLSVHKILAQETTNDSQLAFQYYSDKEYQKAADLYAKMYEKNKVKIYFDYYLRCLLNLKDYVTAEKIIKKQIRANSSDVTYYVELGNLYKIQGKEENANEQFDIAIKKLEYNQPNVILLANAFLNKQEYKYAEKTYLEGRTKSREKYSFRIELANVYARQGLSEKMIDEYLALLNENASMESTVQTYLQYYVTEREEVGISLKNSLLKRIQENNSPPVFSTMLVWYYTQIKNFDQAIVQAKALDKRFDEGGLRLYTIGETASSNNDYDAAIKAYQYVIDKGQNSPYYIESRFDLIRIYYQKIATGIVISQKEIKEVENQYISIINEYQKNRVISLITDLAHLQAFYLGKPKEATALLEDALKTPQIDYEEKEKAKIELADIMVITGDVWESVLLYKQVEQENTESAIGYEAKFKKSKVAYYIGNFRWAQTQLDALKASTSKLIANDAFELSQLIKDHLEEDSTGAALKMYANADLLVLQHKDSLALLTLDSILTNFKTNSLLDEVCFQKAKIYEHKGNFPKAIELYQKVITEFKSEILGDDAMYKIAMIYEYQLKDKEKAMQYYKDLITTYSGSSYVIEARKSYRKLRGDSNF